MIRLDQIPLLVFDFETNGCSGGNIHGPRHSIVQMAVLHQQSGQVFNSLVQPNQWIPAGSTAIHGITNAAVRQSPTFADVMVALRRWMETLGLAWDAEVCWVAHNAFGFDLVMWLRAAGGCGLTLPPAWLWLDTLPLCRGMRAPGDASSCTLSALYTKYFGCEMPNAHDAGGDVVGLGALLPYLLPYVQPSDLRRTTEVPLGLPGTALLTDVRYIGQYVSGKLASGLGLQPRPTPTLGAVRQAMTHLGIAEVEWLLRSAAGVREDARILEILCTLYVLPIRTMLPDFPFLPHAFEPFQFSMTVRKRLCRCGLKTADALYQHFLYACRSDWVLFRRFVADKAGLPVQQWPAFRALFGHVNRLPSTGVDTIESR